MLDFCFFVCFFLFSFILFLEYLYFLLRGKETKEGLIQAFQILADVGFLYSSTLTINLKIFKSTSSDQKLSWVHV